MSERSLEDLYEWAGENLNEIVERIQATLRSNPDKFLSIKELAAVLNWPLTGYTELKLICFIATCDQTFESNHELLQYKYNPREELRDETDSFWNRDTNRKYEELRDDARKFALQFFRGPRERRRLEEQDQRLRAALEQIRRTWRQDLEQYREGF